MTSIFEPLNQINEIPLVIHGDDIDTDQIIPAQFLTTTSRKGLGNKAFYLWRHDKNGDVLSDYYLNKNVNIQSRKVVLVGQNFGCGSSREHAAWALYDYGIRVIIGNGISDIFRNNALKNGMAAIDVSSDVSEQLHTKSHQNILVDLETCHIVSGTDDPIKFELDALSLECLMSGQDQLEKLMEHLPARDKFEAQNTLHFEALI